MVHAVTILGIVLAWPPAGAVCASCSVLSGVLVVIAPNMGNG